MALVAAAQEPSARQTVPLTIQVPALLKALGYNRGLEIAANELVVGVLYDPGDAESVAAKDRILGIQKELTRLTVKGKRVVFEPVAYDRGGALAQVPVLLLTPLPAASIEELSARARSQKVLTLATVGSDVDEGIVLGMEMREGKPRFVFNRTAAAASGASFESGFLELCRIVERGT
jgi:hypothetical protein